MYWNTMYSSVGIRSQNFENYATAKAYHDGVKPIRGDKYSRRPLGTNRRYKHMHIISDDLNDSVSAVLYNTKCVTLFDNGMIKISHDDYVTPTTLNFIEAVMPSKFGKVTRKRGRLIYHEPMSGRKFVVPSTGIWLMADKDWASAVVYEDIDHRKAPLNSVALAPQYEYKADRVVLNKLRAQMRSFLNTVKVMSSMSTSYSIQEIAEYFPEVVDEYMRRVGGAITEVKAELEEDKEVLSRRWLSPSYVIRQIVADHVGLPTFYAYSSGNLRHLEGYKSSTTLEDLKQKLKQHLTLLKYVTSDDANEYRKAMIQIATNHANENYIMENAFGYRFEDFFYDWQNGEPKYHVKARGRIVEGVVPDITYGMSGSAVENYITEIIKYLYADVVFKEVEVAKGTVPSDTNKKYIVANRAIKPYLEDTVTELSLSPLTI